MKVHEEKIDGELKGRILYSVTPPLASDQDDPVEQEDVTNKPPSGTDICLISQGRLCGG
jgi:hypothetical protein